jgi:F-type H+-transporting ATPase subunit delta
MNQTASTPIRPAYSNIARPYALAAFEYANENQNVTTWQSFLESAALIASQSSVLPLLSSPEMTAANWVSFFENLLLDQLDAEKKHFLSLLAYNKRLLVLPEIAALFQEYDNAAQKNVYIKVITAVALDKKMQQAFTHALTKRTHQAVNLRCEIDPAILGGAVIHINDKVIDASLRGKLTRFLAFSLR